MNFIKKKLKSHKKEDEEEEEYEKAVYEQSLHPQVPDQKNKNTEEWQFFQQLSMKVQDTVQKTQTTLNKLKDTSVPNEEDPFDTDNDLLSKETMPYNTTKSLRAPPRPPAPSGDKAPMPIDLNFGSDFPQSSPSKLPPRPPPPAFSESSFPSDSSALHGTTTKSFGSPARPPPPHVTSAETTSVTQSHASIFDSTISNSMSAKSSATFNLLDEFGFQSDSTTSTIPSNTNIQDLLFLDDKEEVDPFDTSFVNVNNITPISTTSDSKINGSQVKSSENNFNPFSGSTPLDTWVASPTNSNKSKKTATNPFFSGTLEEVKSESYQGNVHSTSSHNPFSFGDANPVNTDQEDLFGITIEPSSGDVTNNLFQENDDSPKSPEFECKGIINSAFNDNSEPEPSQDLDNMVKEHENTINSVLQQNLTTEINMWDSDKINEVNAFSSDSVLQFNASTVPEKTSDPSSLWDTDTLNTETLLPGKISYEGENVTKNNEKNDLSDFSEDNNSKSNILSANIETSFPSMEIKPVENNLPPSLNSDFSQFPLPSESETTIVNSEEFQLGSTVKESSSGGFSDLSEGLNSTFPVKRGSISRQDSTPRRESIPQKDSTSRRDSTQQRESISHKEIAPRRESIPCKENISQNESIITISKNELPPTSITEDFSKPFEGENEQNAFLFKVQPIEQKTDLEFDAFAAKFDSVKDSQSSGVFDPFMTKRAPTLKKIQDNAKGFDSMDEFDPFCVTSKVETSQSMIKKEPSRDSFEDYDNEVDFSVVIKPKVKDSSDIKLSTMEPPKLLPPPKTPTKAFDTPASRFNPFDKDFLDNSETPKVTEKVLELVEGEEEPVPALGEAGVRKADSVETPLSPLFDEDTSQPLEIFPKPYDKEGWEMVLRQPNKKKLTGNRFWKKIFVKLSENSVLQLFNKVDDKLPFQELPLQPCYSLSEVGAQQYDQYGKIFTVKLQYKFYRERVGVRPGQISKVTQGQVTSMGDVAKLGLPLQHSPQTSQLLKLGSQSYSDLKYFIQEVEDAIFRMVVHRDRVLTYKTEEVQVIAQDEFYVEQSKTGHIDKQLARVRIFFLAFITGMPSVEVGVNDIVRQGKEVVGRYDIIPVVTEEWIRLEDCEFHSCVIQDEFHKNRVIKFHPPDACLFELLRFRIRPPKNRELPLQVRVFMTVSNTRVEIRSDILVPGYSSRKQGQVPCENIQIRFPVPECWIYLFRTEKHFRYGSKKSAARRPGKIKGLERIIGAAQNLDPSLIEVSAGQAKYEHVFHAVVWRIPRLPKEGQGAYTQQLFLLRTELTSFDQIPESFEQYVDVEFTMPATYVSHTTIRSVSVTNPIPPEKYVRYISKHEYKVEIDFKNSSDEIDSLITAPNVSVPVSTTPAVQESTEDEDKDDESD